MIIGRSDVSLAASSARRVEQTHTERLRVWEQRGGRASAAPERPRVPERSQVPERGQISERGQMSGRRLVPAPAGGPGGSPPAAAAAAGAAGAGAAATAAAGSGSAAGVDRLAARGRFAVLIALVEQLTGRKVQVIDPSEVTGGGGGNGAATGAVPAQVAANPAAANPVADRRGWGIDLEVTDTRVEQQRMVFSAAGTVTTTDGRDIAFSVGLSLASDSVEVSHLRLRAGDATMTDPLVLTLPGGNVALSPSKINFDLNADGGGENISFVSAGSGFLALDRNGNGAVDDGRELFGPTTGDGFAELAAFDDDGNGWIDSGDAVYSQLRFWDNPTGTPKTLAEVGVGAISLARVATPFALPAGGQAAGALQETGVWLGEDGSVGTVHHVDLAM